MHVILVECVAKYNTSEVAGRLVRSSSVATGTHLAD